MSKGTLSNPKCCDDPDLEYQAYSLYQCNNCMEVFSPENHANAVSNDMEPQQGDHTRMSNENEMSRLPKREYTTAAMINIHDAREELGHGNLGFADQALAVAQRQLIYAGSKDIGQLPAARDLDNHIKSELSKKNRKIEHLEEQIEALEEDKAKLRKILSEDEDD